MKSIIASIIIAAAAFCATSASAQGARTPYTSDLAAYTAPNSLPSAPAKMVFMPDGLSFLSLTADAKIVRIDTKSGKVIEVYADFNKSRENTLTNITDFFISPNASKIIVYNESEHVYRRSFKAKYYVYDMHSKILRPLSAEHKYQQAPVFSPNSRMVAFAADNNIYIAKLDFNTEVAVTEDGCKGKIINGTSDWTYEEEFETTCSMAWSPDNTTLCFLKYDETNVPTYPMTMYEGSCHPIDKYALYPGTYEYKYPVAGMPNSCVTLHSYNVDNRKTTPIAFNDSKIEYIPHIAFVPEGSDLIVTTLNRDQNRTEIYSVNPKSTVVKSIYTEESKAWISQTTYSDLYLKPDYMVILSSKSGYLQAYRYNYNGVPTAQLTSGEEDLTDFYGIDDKGNIYYQAAAPSPINRTIYRIDRKGVKTAISPESGWSSATFTPTFDFVLEHSDSKHAPVYTLCNSSGSTLRVIENNENYNKYVAGKMAYKEFFTFDSDGYKLNYYMRKPADFDPQKRYPVIMVQYSGPESQMVTNKWNLDFESYYASQGYIIVCVDGRGTGGRGRAFSDLVYRNLGHYETIDQINAAQQIAKLPYVDSSRIGLYGWSYGGYEALMCATEPNTPFAAIVAIAPVTDWRYYDTVYTERYMLTPQQNDEGYRISAPMSRTSRLTCPLLIMYGTNDDNVHPANSLEFVSRLQSQGLLCDMFVFPNMNHSINYCNARAVVYAKMFDFFKRNLK